MSNFITSISQKKTKQKFPNRLGGESEQIAFSLHLKLKLLVVRELRLLFYFNSFLNEMKKQTWVNVEQYHSRRSRVLFCFFEC